MSNERRSYEKIRRNADRVRERLAATLAKSRVATARDKRTDERAGARDSVEPPGSERSGTRFGPRADQEVDAEPDRSAQTER